MSCAVGNIILLCQLSPRSGLKIDVCLQNNTYYYFFEKITKAVIKVYNEDDIPMDVCSLESATVKSLAYKIRAHNLVDVIQSNSLVL